MGRLDAQVMRQLVDGLLGVSAGFPGWSEIVARLAGAWVPLALVLVAVLVCCWAALVRRRREDAMIDGGEGEMRAATDHAAWLADAQVAAGRKDQTDETAAEIARNAGWWELPPRPAVEDLVDEAEARFGIRGPAPWQREPGGRS